MPQLKAIPTNIITGFLGVGKTTAILHLLAQKPAGERWAVLVNEFGEVGIDGSLFSGQEQEASGVFVREVPGGCMCCAAGIPMQVALNMLLARARPDRLLIEPTGLGHPQEVLNALSAEHYREVLDLRATFVLVDARKVHDARYTDHETFNQQLAIADVIVANKADYYQPRDFPALLDFLDRTVGIGNRSVFQVSQGALQLDWLDIKTRGRGEPEHHHHHQQPFAIPLETTKLPAAGFLSVANEGEGFYSRGWIFSSAWIFDAHKLYAFLLGIEAERVKGVFITSNGITGFNKADNVLTDAKLDDAVDSRIEFIASDPGLFDHLEDALLACVISR